MPLLARIASDHSIAAFRTAARQRFAESIRANMANDRLAAVYLAGYCAEMTLKAAYFRRMGWSPSQPIQFMHMNNAKALARQLGFAWTSLHDVQGWMNLLIAHRQNAGQPYSYALRRTLAAQIGRIMINWAPHLRYHSNRPTNAEVRLVHQATAWLLHQSHQL